LLKIARSSDWIKRDILFREEAPLAKQYWVSMFSLIGDEQLSDERKRYLALTSLPFAIYWGDHSWEIDDQYDKAAVCETVLRKLWKLQEIDETAVLPTGNMRPDYFFIAGSAQPAMPARSFVTHSYFRKALMKANVYTESWCTHLVKFPKMTLSAENVKKHSTLELELELLKPRVMIALGTRVKTAIGHLKLQTDIPLIVLSDPEDYVKHDHPFQDYADAITTVLEEWTKKSTVQ
jgi:hypothetical protein